MVPTSYYYSFTPPVEHKAATTPRNGATYIKNKDQSVSFVDESETWWSSRTGAQLYIRHGCKWFV